VHLSICVLSFYKAQVTQFKEACFNLFNVTVVDCNESISPLSTKTVDSTQGTEYDIVLLFLVKTRNPAFLGEPHRLVVVLTRGR
jgi:superfamily I DNA and/or RNA helicase